MSVAETAEAQMVALTINGQEVQGRSGQTILEAAAAAGIEIPTLCHDPRLEPYGACRMCLVEVEGARGPMAACGTAIKEGMKVQTHSEKIVKIRKFVLELLLTNHPLDCPVCEAAGDCRLQDYAYEYLVDMVPWGWRGPVAGSPGDHPNIAHFEARCILCGRCVRICREVMSIGCWGYLNRGYDSEVDTPYRLPLADVDCVSCGQCVSTCPVGAIVGQRSPLGARAWQTEKTATTCSYCADGCSLELHSYRDRVVKVSAQVGRGLNGGNLCAKGRFGMGYAEAPDRLTKPLVRNKKGELEETSWETALVLVSEKLAAAKKSKGGAGVAAICGTHGTNEAAYLLQKLMRSVLGSNNVDAIDHGEQAASEKALRAAFGAAAATCSRADLVVADAILVVGANLTESHPVLALDVIKAIRQDKAVIVVDPRTTELATKASVHLAVKPGGDVAALRAMMRHVLDLELADKEFIAARTEGLAALETSLQKCDIDAEAGAAGISADLVRAAAAAFGRAATAVIVYGTGAVSGTDGEEVVAALADLAMLTGNVGRLGTGVMPLLSGANSQGLADMGVRPDRLPGDVPVDDADALTRLETAWGASVAGLAGDADAAAMVDPARAAQLDVLYVLGADPALALGAGETAREGLGKVGFLVVQDSFPTDTAALADVVLPAAVAAEDEGTFTNGERVVQRVRAAIAPQGESLPDWKIIQVLANALGADWAYGAPADVMEEIADVVPVYKGVSYEKIEEQGVAWPCTGADCPGTALLHTVDFSRGKGAFAAVAPTTTAAGTAATSGDLPLGLISGSVRAHHGTGERSRRSPGVTSLVAEASLEMNPSDAEKAGLAQGDKARVTGVAGSVEVAAHVTARVPEGIVFLPGFSATAPLKRLLGADGSLPAGVRVERAG